MLSKLWSKYGSMVTGSIIGAVVVFVLGVPSYVAKGIYDAPVHEERLKGDLIRTIESAERALSTKLDDQSRKLDDQSKQLENSRKDIQSIKQALLTLVLNSNVKPEDKDRMIRQLGAAIDPAVIAAATEFTHGRYGSAYAKWFELSSQGNADARSAIFSASDVLYGKISAREATPKERQAFSDAIYRAKQLGITDLIGRYKVDSPGIMLYKQPKTSNPETKGTTQEPVDSAIGEVQRNIEGTPKDSVRK